MTFNKIAISGSAGIGKTALCKKLAFKLNYPIISDKIDVVLKQYGYISWKEVHNPTKIIKVRLEALNKKIKAEKNTPCFISDKSVIDYFAYWIINSTHSATQKERTNFLDMVIDHIKCYELILLLPYGRIPLKDKRKRNISSKHQLKIHSKITYLLNKFKLPFIPYDPYQENTTSLDICFTDIKKRLLFTTNRNIGLFIGTFDPITLGHTCVAQKAMEIFDEIWFCPNPYNRYSKRHHQPLMHRINMIRIVIENVSSFKTYVRKINPYATNQGNKARSILLQEISTIYPKFKFSIIMGSDKLTSNAYNFPDSIIKETQHIIFRRPGYILLLSNIPKLNSFIIHDEVSGISSSFVKQKLKFKKYNITGLLDHRVIYYIKNHNLYLPT